MPLYLAISLSIVTLTCPFVRSSKRPDNDIVSLCLSKTSTYTSSSNWSDFGPETANHITNQQNSFSKAFDTIATTDSSTISSSNTANKQLPRMPRDFQVETHRSDETVNTSIQAMLNIKLEVVQKRDVPEDKRDEDCTLCSDALFPEPPAKKRKTRRLTMRPSSAGQATSTSAKVVKLLPCGHYYHSKCIGEWVVCEKGPDAILANEDVGNGEIERVGDFEVVIEDGREVLIEDGIPWTPVEPDIEPPAEPPPAGPEHWIEFPDGWISIDGVHIHLKDRKITAKCPMCQAAIVPAEEHWDYGIAWTNLERQFVRSWFHEIEGHKMYLDRSGDSAQFAVDLRAARAYAHVQIQRLKESKKTASKGSSAEPAT